MGWLYWPRCARRSRIFLVVLLTAYGSLKTAVDAIKAGAFDYLSKPFVVDDIRLVVRRALEHKKLVRENRSLRDQLRERYRFDNLVGSSGGMVGCINWSRESRRQTARF